MRHKTSKKIYAYWDNLRKGRPAPDRCEIEPSDIRDYLGDTFILEIDPKLRTISFRLAGTRLCSAYARELKGVGFLGLWDEKDNMSIYNAVRQVYQDYKACTISTIAQSGTNRFVEYEILMLPLSTGHLDNIRILGVASPKQTPYWLGSDPIVNNRISAVRYLDTCNAEQADADAMIVALDPVRDDLINQANSRRVKHLIVLDGGREA